MTLSEWEQAQEVIRSATSLTLSSDSPGCVGQQIGKALGNPHFSAFGQYLDLCHGSSWNHSECVRSEVPCPAWELAVINDNLVRLSVPLDVIKEELLDFITSDGFVEHCVEG